jgi:hypothetical protein
MVERVRVAGTSEARMMGRGQGGLANGERK